VGVVVRRAGDRPSVWRAGGIVVNVLIVVYLADLARAINPIV
jgi:hypothetical protein